jgi:hypothetical protein
MPLVEAIHHFVEANGRWPSYETIYQFINKLGIIVESPDRTWHQLGTAAVIEKGREYRTGLGLESPPGSGARKGRAPWGTEIKVPEGGIPGALTGRTGRAAVERTKEELLDALDRFDLELRPRSVPRTRARYVTFASQHQLPSATTINKHGGFTKMLAEARERRRALRSPDVGADKGRKGKI